MIYYSINSCHSGLDPESLSQSEEILNQVQDDLIKVHNTIGLTIYLIYLKHLVTHKEK